MAAGELAADNGAITRPESVGYCDQRTDEADESAREFLEAEDHDAFRLFDLLGIDPGWLGRWDTLSHDERFLDALTHIRWRIEPSEGGYQLRVES